MQSPIDGILQIAAVARERRVSVAAAGLAYHAFNTLVPLVILLFVGVSGTDSLEPALDVLESASGVDAATSRSRLDAVTGNGGSNRLQAAALALVILLWSAIRLFRAIDGAFQEVYDARPTRSPLEVAANVSLAATTIAIAVGLAAVVGVTLSFAIDGLAWALLSPFVLVALLVPVFLPTYYLFPQTDVTVREALPGTVFAAVAWTVLALGFRFYAASAGSVRLYGVAGAVLLLSTWVYLGGLCLLFGAVANAVLAERVDPDDAWVPLAAT